MENHRNNSSVMHTALYYKIFTQTIQSSILSKIVIEFKKSCDFQNIDQLFSQNKKRIRTLDRHFNQL